MTKRLSPHLVAVLQALFVTVLWASSWVLIKIGLADLPALPFAGLRYMLAVVCLLPFVARPASRAALRGLTRPQGTRLVILGVIYIAVAQGAQFLALAYLPAVTVSLLLNFTPVVVAGLGLVVLGERPTARQWGGVGLFLIGALVYFTPVAFPAGEVVGLGVAGVCVLANAGSAVLGRHINRVGGDPAADRHRGQYGGRGDAPAGRRRAAPGIARAHAAPLGDHRLAGRGQYGLRLHPLEPHLADPLGDGVERYQQHDDGPDRAAGLALPG